MIEPVSAHLLYVAYNGWIYSGRLFWKIDKISLMEGRTGSYLTHCKRYEKCLKTIELVHKYKEKPSTQPSICVISRNFCSKNR